MKNILKVFILILSISLVNCKKDDSIRTVELENELAIVKKITDYLGLGDDLFYLELVNEHTKLNYTALLVYNVDVFHEQYKKEGLAVKISGFAVVYKTPSYIDNLKDDIYIHNFHLTSIETVE